jgi:hypothetical protein
MFYSPEIRDYSISYKTFNDLCDGDKVFLIDYEKLEITEYTICDYEKKDSSDYYRQNCFEVSFKILHDQQTKKLLQVKIYDGNTFIYDSHIGHYIYLATDKRIADTIIQIMRSRNENQWDSFSSIFGNPLHQRYQPRDIVLR